MSSYKGGVDTTPIVIPARQFVYPTIPGGGELILVSTTEPRRAYYPSTGSAVPASIFFGTTATSEIAVTGTSVLWFISGTVPGANISGNKGVASILLIISNGATFNDTDLNSGLGAQIVTNSGANIRFGARTCAASFSTLLNGTTNLTAPSGIRTVIIATPGNTTMTGTDFIGLNVQNNSSGSATMTGNAGIKFTGVAAGSTTVNASAWFGTDTAQTGAGIVFGTVGDCSIYRNATGNLNVFSRVRTNQLRCASGTPSIAAGAGAGTTPTLGIFTGTDMGLLINLTQGNPTATGVIFTVTFTQTYANAPAITFAPGNAATAALTGTSCPFVTSTATTFVLNSGATALVAGTSYSWHFIVAPRGGG